MAVLTGALLGCGKRDARPACVSTLTAVASPDDGASWPIVATSTPSIFTEGGGEYGQKKVMATATLGAFTTQATGEQGASPTAVDLTEKDCIGSTVHFPVTGLFSVGYLALRQKGDVFVVTTNAFASDVRIVGAFRR